MVIDRINAEGALLTVVDADYDGAVRAARAADSDGGGLLIQDTAWDGYEQVPSWIVAGYETLFAEIDAQLAAAGGAPFGGARRRADQRAGRGGQPRPGRGGALPAPRPAPERNGRCCCRSSRTRPRACCAAWPTGELASVPTAATVMNGLNCGTPSSIAWPYLRDGLDAAIAVTDADAREAVAALSAAGVTAGPSGAAGLAGLRAALTGAGAASRRRDLGLDAGGPPVIVCLSTEGPLEAVH